MAPILPNFSTVFPPVPDEDALVREVETIDGVEPLRRSLLFAVVLRAESTDAADTRDRRALARPLVEVGRLDPPIACADPGPIRLARGPGCLEDDAAAHPDERREVAAVIPPVLDVAPRLETTPTIGVLADRAEPGRPTDRPAALRGLARLHGRSAGSRASSSGSISAGNFNEPNAGLVGAKGRTARAGGL